MINVMSMLKHFWYIWVLIIILEILNIFKPKIKGIIGEKAVATILSRLDKNKYIIINDVIVEILGKTTQIDHIVVSNYGIFVIETKNYKGRIYGDNTDKIGLRLYIKEKRNYTIQ